MLLCQYHKSVCSRMYTETCERESRINLLYGAANAILHQRPVARDRPVSLDVTVRYLDFRRRERIGKHRTHGPIGRVQDSQMDRIVSKDQQNQVASQALRIRDRLERRPTPGEAAAQTCKAWPLLPLAARALRRVALRASCAFPWTPWTEVFHPSHSLAIFLARKEAKARMLSTCAEERILPQSHSIRIYSDAANRLGDTQ